VLTLDYTQAAGLVAALLAAGFVAGVLFLDARTRAALARSRKETTP
jgi:hypothetical protein